MTNIFFTSENLVLALPLITICGGYAFFKYIPLKVGVPFLVGVAAILHLRSRMKIKQAEKSLKEVVDESMMQDLAAEEEVKKAKSKAAAAKKQQKAEEKLRQRLKAEKKAENVKKSSGGKGGNVEEDDDEDDALLTFAKGGRVDQKKKR